MWVNQFYLGHYIDSCVGEYEMDTMSFYISHMKNIYHRMSASFNAPLAFFFFFICRCTIGADQNSYCFLSPSQKYQEISRFHALPPLSLLTWEDIQAQVIHTEFVLLRCTACNTNEIDILKNTQQWSLY